MATFFHLESGLICLVDNGVLIALLNPDRKLASKVFDRLRGRRILGAMVEPGERESSPELMISLDEIADRRLGTCRLVIQLPKKNELTMPVVKIETGMVPTELQLRLDETPSRPMDSDPPPADDSASAKRTG